MTCNFHCDKAVQCSIGYVQIAVCTLHYALLQHVTVDLQVVLCKLHVSVLHCGTDYFQFGLCKLCHKTMQCSTGNLQLVVCQLCYVVQQCSCGEFQLHCANYYKFLTAIRNRRNAFAVCKIYDVVLLCCIGEAFFIVQGSILCGIAV